MLRSCLLFEVWGYVYVIVCSLGSSLLISHESGGQAYSAVMSLGPSYIAVNSLVRAYGAVSSLESSRRSCQQSGEVKLTELAAVL